MNILEHHLQFKRLIVQIEMPRFNSKAILELLKAVTFNCAIEDITSTRNNKTKIYRFQFDSDDWRYANLKSEIARIFNPNLFTITETSEPEYKDIWEYYLYLIDTMDWYYSYSDDYTIWSAGQSQFNLIKDLTTALVKIDEDRVKTITEGKFPENSNYKQYIRK